MGFVMENPSEILVLGAMYSDIGKEETCDMIKTVAFSVMVNSKESVAKGVPQILMQPSVWVAGSNSD
jgi:hypothetical protein